MKGEYYHVFNRGVEKRNIFLTQQDYERFLVSLFSFRKQGRIKHFPRLALGQHSVLTKVAQINQIIEKQSDLVKIAAFCLMPNHFHLLLKECSKNGISYFMQRVGNSFTKYINTKYERTGHLFNAPFKAIHIKRNPYLIYLSRYIHLNPANIMPTGQHILSYPWSSYPDFIIQNRWGDGLHPSIILSQFSSVFEYQKYNESEIHMVNTQC